MITRQDLSQLERYLDQAWNLLGIDVHFGYHFFERVNDPRNGKQITYEELRKLFVDTYKKFGNAFSKMSKKDTEIEGVLSDLSTKINSPFVLKWDPRNREFDLIGKTVMRKANFVPNNPREKKFTVEDNDMSTKTNPLHKKFGVSDDFYQKINQTVSEGYKELKTKEDEFLASTKRSISLFEDKETEQIDELSRQGPLTRYIDRVKSDVKNDKPLSDKRKKGFDLALRKKWGGPDKAKVKATEDIEQVDENKKIVNVHVNVHSNSYDRSLERRIFRTGGTHKEIRNNVKKFYGPKFHSIHKIENVKEDIEQIDEISKNTMNSYYDKAHVDRKKSYVARNIEFDKASKAKNVGKDEKASNHYEKAKNLTRRIKNRDDGMMRVARKVSEDIEQVDELSQGTLGSYLNKASKSLDVMRQKHHSSFVKVLDAIEAKKATVKELDVVNKQFAKGIEKRKEGLGRASDKIKEESELTEISDSTKKSYMIKTAGHAELLKAKSAAAREVGDHETANKALKKREVRLHHREKLNRIPEKDVHKALGTKQHDNRGWFKKFFGIGHNHK